MASLLLKNLLFGGMLGSAPIAFTVSSTTIFGRDRTSINKNDPGFGKTCLLEEDVCEAISNENFVEDTDAISDEEAKQNQEYQSDYWKKRKDDFCGWGWQWENLNTHLQCDAPDATKPVEAQTK